MTNKNTKHTLVSFTCSWGYTKGGINAFNTDFLEAMANAYLDKVNIVCVVLAATEAEIEAAKEKNITLIESYYQPESDDTAKNVLDNIHNQGILLDPKNTIFLGHDRISGEIALLTAKLVAGRSALIHHMSYDHYESFAEDSASAKKKADHQASLFTKADIAIAVGPLLRDALVDMIDKAVDMIIPGLAEIEPRTLTPKTFSMFVSGRLSEDSSRNKQGQLALAAFATCCKKAKKQQYPASLYNKRPKLLMRGVDFEGEDTNEPHYSASEKNLKLFAQEYSGSVINLHALPYTKERNELFDELKKSSLAAMPSWHEGFGLVAWEAIAAGVPLIISKESGVFQLISENHSGFDSGFIWPVDIEGQVEEPNFSDNDLSTVCNALMEVAKNPEKARQKASTLRSELSQYTWTSCAEKACEIFGWELQKGVIGESALVEASSMTNPKKIKPSVKEHIEVSGLSLPQSSWSPSSGMAASVLLKASEEVVPFDTNRQADLDKLFNWITEDKYPLAVRLIKGQGGVGKTRLASELCKQLKKQDWNAGFYGNNEEITLAMLWNNCCANQKNNVIVIDYAETRSKEILSLIKLIVQTQQVNKTRLLLLARDSGEWWDNLAAKDTVSEDILSCPATTGPYTLSPLYNSLDERKRGFQIALSAFSKVLGVSSPIVNPDLLGKHFDKPLFIQMAALLALRGEQPKSSDGITRAVLNHEQRYWAATLANAKINQDVSLAKKLLALVTLAGNFQTARQAFSYWELLDDANISLANFSKVFNCLVPLYPGSQGLQAIKPDLLGEELVAQVLLSSGDNLLTAVLNKTSSEKIREHALTLLARLSDYKPDLLPIIETSLVVHLASNIKSIISVATETASKLPELASQALKKQPRATQNSLATQLSHLIVNDSLALNILCCEASRIIYEKSKLKARKKNNLRNLNIQSAFIGSIINYSWSLYKIGNNADALNISKEGLEIGDNLLSKGSSQEKAIYAQSLSNHAVYLGGSGKEIEAEGIAQQALTIREKLAEQYPERYQSVLATSLSNYANRLSDLDKTVQAEGIAKQALIIREKLAEQNPDRYQLNLAGSLNNYASILSDLGKTVEAEDVAQQALTIREKLVEQNPKKHACRFVSACFECDLLSWQNGKSTGLREFPVEDYFEYIQEVDLAKIKFFMVFISAIKATDLENKKILFKKIVDMYIDFSISQKVNCEEYFHCAFAWLFSRKLPLKGDEKWLRDWLKYKEQRNSNIPKWMLFVAKKLEFTFP